MAYWKSGEVQFRMPGLDIRLYPFCSDLGKTPLITGIASQDGSYAALPRDTENTFRWRACSPSGASRDLRGAAVARENRSPCADRRWRAGERAPHRSGLPPFRLDTFGVLEWVGVSPDRHAGLGGDAPARHGVRREVTSDRPIRPGAIGVGASLMVHGLERLWKGRLGSVPHFTLWPLREEGSRDIGPILGSGLYWEEWENSAVNWR